MPDSCNSFHQLKKPGSIRVAVNLLKSSVIPNAQTPDSVIFLGIAAQKARFELCKLLLGYGSDPDMKNTTGNMRHFFLICRVVGRWNKC